MKKINVIDFDYTIYDGDSSLDFYKFCLKKKPFLLRYLPFQAFHYVLFAMRLETRTVFKSNFFIYLRGLQDVDTMLEQFWAGHKDKIKKWYKALGHGNDVIVSASPDFLLRPMLHNLGAVDLIATVMDKSNGRITGLNCHGEEKLKRLQGLYEDVIIERAYSDSLFDLPVLNLAREPFVVIGEKVMTLKEYMDDPRHARQG